ncbi:hypothetical protein H8356DRAFT_1333996 [Neocallimastix lanati (nom. inval.)]|nr:hypothetical protein H8356DRAFT_1333996 [Neocallimastix sp. JGI-2020a]
MQHIQVFPLSRYCPNYRPEIGACTYFHRLVRNWRSTPRKIVLSVIAEYSEKAVQQGHFCLYGSVVTTSIFL